MTGDTVLRVEDDNRLTDEIGGDNAVTGFGFAPKRTTKMILETAFIDTKISSIKTNRSQILPRRDPAVAVIENSEAENAV